MNRQITKKQYVIIDMLIFAIILCVLEAASRWALDLFPRELFTISVVLPIALIAMMRHGAWGIGLAMLGGAVYCIANNASIDVYIIYIFGNAFVAVNLLWFKKAGKDKLIQSTGLIVLYVIMGYVSMNLGRSIFALIFGYPQFFATMVRYFTTDALSAVMSIIIILIARRQDGVFEDQMVYLRRRAAEEEQRNANKA